MLAFSARLDLSLALFHSTQFRPICKFDVFEIYSEEIDFNSCFFRKYDACSPTPCYRTADDSMQIKPDDEIRVKVISIREDANDIFVLGTLLDDFLGLVSSD